MKINIKMNKAMFNDAYLPLLFDYEDRYKVFYGGGGSGKSHFVFQKLVFKGLKFPNRKILVVRKVGNTLRDSCFAMVKTILSDWHIYEECKINKTDSSLHS